PSTTTARGGGCATWSGWPTGWRRSPASWFRPRACCAGSLLTREHRAPRTVPRRPRKVVLVQHGHDRRGDDWLPGARCGSSQDRAEGDERLGCVERPRHELRGSAGAVNRGAEKAIAPRVEPEHALPRDRGVIELFGPLQAQVVEQRLHHACSRRIGRVAVVPREPDLEAPRADQPVEDAAGRLEVRRLGGRGRRQLGPAESLATLGGEPPGSEDRPGERAERQSDRSISAGSADSHGPGVLPGLCHWWAGWKRRGRRGSRGRAACVSAATLQPAPSGSDQPPQALHTGPDPILALALLH